MAGENPKGASRSVCPADQGCTTEPPADRAMTIASVEYLSQLEPHGSAEAAALKAFHDKTLPRLHGGLEYEVRALVLGFLGSSADFKTSR